MGGLIHDLFFSGKQLNFHHLAASHGKRFAVFYYGFEQQTALIYADAESGKIGIAHNLDQDNQSRRGQRHPQDIFRQAGPSQPGCAPFTVSTCICRIDSSAGLSGARMLAGTARSYRIFRLALRRNAAIPSPHVPPFIHYPMTVFASAPG